MKKKDLPKFERRLGIILMLILLLVAGAFIFYFSWEVDFEQSAGVEFGDRSQLAEYEPPAVPQKNRQNPERLAQASLEADKVRTASEYYARRAYAGAPPVIPHPLTSPDNCLSCHRDGGYVPKWDRYTPITPHPDFQACLQCHVEQKSGLDFSQMAYGKNLYEKIKGPSLKNKALVSSPAPVPHSLQLRENCVSCHGPGAPKEWRSPHPQRGACLQCHVAKEEEK